MAYPTAAGQGLYDASTTRVHKLGAVHSFTNSDGTITLARYVKNDSGSNIAAGQVVLYAGAEGEIGGVSAIGSPPAAVAGGAAVAMATNGYGWVIFRGKQTNASCASTTSSSADRYLWYGGTAAALQVAAATYATDAAYAASVCALLKAGTAPAASATNTVYWTWR